MAPLLHVIACLICTAVPVACRASAQEPAPAQVVSKRVADARPQELAAGVLPANAKPAAVEAWKQLVAASMPGAAEAPGEHPPEVRAFDLEFDVLTRDGAQTNEGRVRHRWLAPGFLRTRLESGREQGLGPGGYWLLDPAAKEGQQVVSLAGREYAEDRRGIDDALALSRNFVALADLGALRIVRLALIAKKDAVDEVPASRREAAGELTWIELTSPDFRLPGDAAAPAGSEPPTYRVRIGMSPETGRALFASIRRAEPPPARTVDPGVLLELRNPAPVDGYLLPKLVTVWNYERRHLSVRPDPVMVFGEKPDQEFYLVQGSLAPTLTAADFDPR